MPMQSDPHPEGKKRLLEFEVINQSMVKTMNRCPRQVMYKHVDGLLPRVLSKPLTRGQWFHSLLEYHYQGKDWKIAHNAWKRKFNALFDEEKEKLGDLPREMFRLMLSYLWHYKNEGEWEVLEVEKTIEVRLPSGRLFKGRVDMLIRDANGLWLVDHKTHKTLPQLYQRQLDMQSPLYIWACWQNGINVDGFMWNYIKTKAPSVPRVLKNGKGFYKNLGETDYYTFAVALRKAGFDPDEYRDKLNFLKSQRYEEGKIQTSPFFQRHVLERSEESVEQAVREMLVAEEKIEEYDFDPRWTQRVNDRSCQFMCSYTDLCIAELHGHNTRLIMRNYRKGDPLEYYEEKLSEEED